MHPVAEPCVRTHLYSGYALVLQQSRELVRRAGHTPYAVVEDDEQLVTRELGLDTMDVVFVWFTCDQELKLSRYDGVERHCTGTVVTTDARDVTDVG